MTFDEFRKVLDDVGETPCMAWPDAFFLDEDSSASIAWRYSCVGGAQYAYSASTMRSIIGKGLECGAVSHPKKEGV